MSLFQLPAETLIQIFDHVGSCYFRSDLSRLTVCKQWSRFAHAACFREFYVDQNTLRRLQSSPYGKSSLPLVKDSVEILDLDLQGFTNWGPVPLSLHRNISYWDDDDGLAVRTAWSTELNNSLLYLATTINQSRKLRMLRIQATSERHPLLYLLERRDYLFLSTARAFLSASNLTSLELDLCGTGLVPHQSQEEHDEGFHVCTTIAALLSTLRRLRLRMRRICAHVLQSKQHNSTNLRLSEVLVNLSLANESPLTTSAVHATCCASSTGGLLQLKADMEKQAQVLVTQMVAPKIVRILTHTRLSVEMRAFDALTGSSVKLSEGAKWDDDGEAIEEEVSEDDESEISDLSEDDG